MTNRLAADHSRGVLIGLAAGDRIGGPIRMAVRLAESLLDCGGFNAMNILERYLDWWGQGAFDTGPVSGRALELMSSGTPLVEAALQVHREFAGKTAGCNPAHRSAPLSMIASIPDNELANCAMNEARLTHHHPAAGEVAAIVNKLCRALIRGASWDDAIRECALTVPDEPGNSGGFSPDVLQAAAFFVGTSTGFSEALDRSMAFAGNENYCPVLVGAIGGARWGASAISDFWLAHVDLLPRVRAAAECLSAGWAMEAG
jgi:ADP-ribosylglycohydrolase